MAGKITEEQKVLINELYCKYNVKTRVAHELGISVASVSRYIIPNYIPKANRVINLKPIETESFTPDVAALAKIFTEKLQSDGNVSEIILLSKEEWNDLSTMQEEEIF